MNDWAIELLSALVPNKTSLKRLDSPVTSYLHPHKYLHAHPLFFQSLLLIEIGVTKSRMQLIRN